MFNFHELQDIIEQPNTVLCEIMIKNFCDKASSNISRHHNYSKLYSNLFEKNRCDIKNILEIGIGSKDPKIPSNMCGGILGQYYQPGASLLSWLEYFPNAHIFACDIDVNLFPLFQNHPRITVFYLDQTNPISIENQLQTILKDIEFDIIIDDGLHHFPTNCEVMNKLLPKVKKGGTYIIEDINNIEYSCRNFNFNLLNDKNYQYVMLPNINNCSDNNLFIVKS